MPPRQTHYPRFLATRLREALRDSPAVLIHGPRQSGKSTLARTVGEPLGYRYITFDDVDVLRTATNDPIGFASSLPSKTILDEVQRAPSLFASLKAVIDRRRTAGRLILTGSANVLLVPLLADSLAGRMEILRLHPLAQCEIARARPRFLDMLFRSGFRAGFVEPLGEDLFDAVIGGGYPAALARRAPGRRRAWYRDLVESQIQRDVQDLSRIHRLDALPRLLALVASNTASLLNVSDLAAPFQLARQTIQDYVTLLERLFLVDRLPPWHANRLSRLVKTPKLHFADTGLACALLGVDSRGLCADRTRAGALIETFVLQEMRRQASWHASAHQFFHYRDRDDFEADIVVERGSTHVAGVEVKLAATALPSDFRGLRKLRERAGARFVCGVVLYDGRAVTPFDDRLFAVPLRLLWGSA